MERNLEEIDGIMTPPNDRTDESDRNHSPAGPAERGAAGQNEGGPSDIAALEETLAAAEARAAEHKDLYMRALAELDNVRKRAARDVEHARKFALERFAGDLIGVKDSLELGLASAAARADARAENRDARPDTGAEARALIEGTEATLKLLAKAFDSAGIVEISPTGEPFDPQLHEAMAMQPSADHAPHTVLQVVQKGYQLNGRLLRPARVIVAQEVS